MKAIHRYVVPVGASESQPQMHRLWGDPMWVGCRTPDEVEFWAVHDDGALTVDRAFIVLGTGHALPTASSRYWGTAVSPGGSLVWHLFELTSAESRGVA